MRAVSNLFSWSSSLDLLVQKQAAICHQTLYKSVPERFWKHVAVTALKRVDGRNVAGKEDKFVFGSAKRVRGALENVWEQSLLFTMLHKVGKAESEQACWTSFVYIIKASGTDFHMSIGETPATFCIYMESWLPFTFIWHDVLSTGSAFPEEQNSSCRARILCDLQTCVHGHKLC